MLPNIDNNKKIGNDLFASIGLMAGPREEDKETTKKEIFYMKCVMLEYLI